MGHLILTTKYGKLKVAKLLTVFKITYTKLLNIALLYRKKNITKGYHVGLLIPSIITLNAENFVT